MSLQAPLQSPLQAVAVLREEHRWIARMLDCLQHLVEDAGRRERLDAEAAAELLALFEHFADGIHQQREESALFPRLFARAASVAERVALGRLCGEHEEERRALRLLNEHLLGAIYGRGSDLASFLRTATVFLRLHREHLCIENTDLLPLAERLLQPEDDAPLLRFYTQLELGGPSAASIDARIRDLSARLGLQPASAPGASEH